MSTRPDPEFTNHLAFVTDRRLLFGAPGPTPRCMICRRDDVDFSCERCGRPICGTCHYAHAASAGEVAIFEAAVREMNAHRPVEIDGEEALLWVQAGPAEQAVNRLLLLCRGCRS